jgi:hypothetical protein
VLRRFMGLTSDEQLKVKAVLERELGDRLKQLNA